jgi:hypothetical protein
MPRIAPLITGWTRATGRNLPGPLQADEVGGLAPAVVLIPFDWISTAIGRKPTTGITKAQIGMANGPTAYSSATPAQVRQYGVSTAQVTLTTDCDADPQNLATFLTTWQAVPRPRQPTLTFDLFDARWATDANALVVLGVGLAQRVRITGAPAGTPPGALEFTVQGIRHSIGVEQRTVTWSTAALIGTTTTGGLQLDGNPGNYASTPDAAPLDIVGDIDLRVEATMTDWTPAGNSTLISKRGGAGNRSYMLQVLTTGVISMIWSTDGTAGLGDNSTVAPTVANNARLAIRATLAVDNLAGGHTTTFYTAPTIDGPWTVLGAPVVTAGTTVIFAGTAPTEVGSFNGGLSDVLAGTIHAAQIRNGIDGTVVAAPSFKGQLAGTTTFTDSAGRVWTVNGTAQITATTLTPGPWFRWDSSQWGGTDQRPF